MFLREISKFEREECIGGGLKGKRRRKIHPKAAIVKTKYK